MGFSVKTLFGIHTTLCNTGTLIHCISKWVQVERKMENLATGNKKNYEYALNIRDRICSMLTELDTSLDPELCYVSRMIY